MLARIIYDEEGKYIGGIGEVIKVEKNAYSADYRIKCFDGKLFWYPEASLEILSKL